MKRFARIALALGILALIAVGGHMALEHLATGSGTLAQNAQASCAYCH